MNLSPLFTTARAVSAVYKIASTGLLLFYLIKRVTEGRGDPHRTPYDDAYDRLRERQGNSRARMH